MSSGKPRPPRAKRARKLREFEETQLRKSTDVDSMSLWVERDSKYKLLTIRDRFCSNVIVLDDGDVAHLLELLGVG